MRTIIIAIGRAWQCKKWRYHTVSRRLLGGRTITRIETVKWSSSDMKLSVSSTYKFDERCVPKTIYTIMPMGWSVSSRASLARWLKHWSLFRSRNEDIFGADPHIYNPERWFAGAKKGVNVGVYSNLWEPISDSILDYMIDWYRSRMAFGGGIRGCIGWRFA